mmetsp:Transcript_7765/g.48171  ORF Transcript_7765/g.48171 Transcript_7765/m.48171 type:complete len:170 (-) Transcript_7765:302-811(-)
MVREEALAKLLLAVWTKRDESKSAPHAVRARRRQVHRRHLAERLEASRKQLVRHLRREATHVDAHVCRCILRHGFVACVGFLHARRASRRQVDEHRHVQWDGVDTATCSARHKPDATRVNVVHVHEGRRGMDKARRMRTKHAVADEGARNNLCLQTWKHNHRPCNGRKA